MKTQWLILGVYSGNPPALPHLLVRCTEDMIDSYDGAVLSPKGAMLFTGGFKGEVPTPEKDGEEPVAFDSWEEAQAFVATEKAEGSTWTYALWPHTA